MNTTFEMVAKTVQGLEAVLADELRRLGANNVLPGKRMVSFEGDLEMLYRANMCCRTALRILKPIYSFEARNADELYAKVKAFDWGSLLNVEGSFSLDTTVYSEEFRHSQFVTYRVKDAIVDWFRDRDPQERRPRVSLEGADLMINIHISGHRVTLSLDSSGESLHRRGWRDAQTEAPISEVLAAGIILLSGWDGTTPFVDPMCGSGTFVVEAAMIAAGINPGVYRKHFAFEKWADFDADLLQKIYDDDSTEREVTVPIVAADIAPRALEIARQNARSAGVEQYITFERRSIDAWEEAPAPEGTIVTNPPYGKRIGSDDMNALYAAIGSTLKHVFTGWQAWIIGYTDEYFREIGLAPSQKIDMNNGGLDCELRQYIIFSGNKKSFRASGGRLKEDRPARERERDRKPFKNRDRRDDDRKPFKKGPRRDDDQPRDRKPYGDKPFRGKPRRDDDERRDAKPREEKRRPLRIKGRTPQLSSDNEIVVNRPAWRTRKKD